MFWVRLSERTVLRCSSNTALEASIGLELSTQAGGRSVDFTFLVAVLALKGPC
jgi:hypothetical protein